MLPYFHGEITAEPVEMPFVGLTRMGPRNHVLGGARSPKGRGIFGGCLLH